MSYEGARYMSLDQRKKEELCVS